MITAHYSPYCLCASCSRTTFYTMARSALDEREYAKRARVYELRDEMIREREKLVHWNEWAKGDIA
jgi:hypothetical protein